jgi:HK97 gp10 family phage protein
MFTVKIHNSKRLQKKINSYGKKAPKALDQALTKAAFNTQNIAVLEIQQGAKTGRVYKKRGGKAHKASAAGEAPATDEGILVQNITVEKKKIMHYDVGSRKAAPHGYWLEFGTSRMDARPWLTPAVKIARKELSEDLKRIKVQ